MRLYRPGSPLRWEMREIPSVTSSQILIRVLACAVCRTDLHVVDGELPEPQLPIIPGHEVVGEVVARGEDAVFDIGTRVGVPWLGYTCGTCDFCLTDRENLCDAARFTGYQLDGGYAEHMVADSRYCFVLPASFDDASAAPLLCAGLIGYRSLKMARDARHLGIYGFGAAAHVIAQVAAWQKREIYAFTRDNDIMAKNFARALGAVWAGDSESPPPRLLDAAIIFAPLGYLIPVALRAVKKGGIVVCGGIHMSDIPAFPYESLWGERTVCSVANLTRRDAIEFLDIAPRVPIRTRVQLFKLADANLALSKLRAGQITGAAVIIP